MRNHKDMRHKKSIQTTVNEAAHTALMHNMVEAGAKIFYHHNGKYSSGNAE